MALLSLILLIAALVVFLLGAFSVPAIPPRVQLVPLGLALWVLSLLLGSKVFV